MIVALTALIGLASMQLSLPLTLAFALAVSLGTFHHMNCLIGFDRLSVRRAEFADGTWWLTFSNGRLVKAKLKGRVVVLPLVTSAQFSFGGEQITWVVAADSVSITEHRRLRVILLQDSVEFDATIRSTVSRWYQSGISWLPRL